MIALDDDTRGAIRVGRLRDGPLLVCWSEGRDSGTGSKSSEGGSAPELGLMVEPALMRIGSSLCQMKGYEVMAVDMLC